jgi:hypothetical protein
MALLLLGVLFLGLSYRSTGAVKPGTTTSHTYYMVVEPYKFKSLNFTTTANISVILTLDSEFPPGVNPEAYDTGEGCIDVLVLDGANYYNWLRNQSSSTIFSESEVHANNYILQIGSEGTYYLVLSNAGRCTAKIVTVGIQETTSQIIGGQQFQVEGLASLSLGAVLAIYGFTKEKAPAVKVEEKASEQGDVTSQDKGASEPIYPPEKESPP